MQACHVPVTAAGQPGQRTGGSRSGSGSGWQRPAHLCPHQQRRRIGLHSLHPVPYCAAALLLLLCLPCRWRRALLLCLLCLLGGVHPKHARRRLQRSNQRRHDHQLHAAGGLLAAAQHGCGGRGGTGQQRHVLLACKPANTAVEPARLLLPGRSAPVHVAAQGVGLVPPPLRQACVQVLGEAGVVETLPARCGRARGGCCWVLRGAAGCCALAHPAPSTRTPHPAPSAHPWRMKWMILVLGYGVRLSCGSYLAGFSAEAAGGVAPPAVSLALGGVLRPLTVLSAAEAAGVAWRGAAAAASSCCASRCAATAGHLASASRPASGLKPLPATLPPHHHPSAHLQTRGGSWPRCAGSLASRWTRSGWATRSTASESCGKRQARACAGERRRGGVGVCLGWAAPRLPAVFSGCGRPRDAPGVHSRAIRAVAPGGTNAPLQELLVEGLHILLELPHTILLVRHRCAPGRAAVDGGRRWAEPAASPATGKHCTTMRRKPMGAGSDAEAFVSGWVVSAAVLGFLRLLASAIPLVARSAAVSATSSNHGSTPVPPHRRGGHPATPLGRSGRPTVCRFQDPSVRARGSPVLQW